MSGCVLVETFKARTGLMELKHEALSHFLDSIDGVEIFPTVGGVNNFCDHVKLPNGTRFVLRIYNNGNDYPVIMITRPYFY